MSYIFNDLAGILPFLPVALIFGGLTMIGILSYQVDKKREVQLGYNFSVFLFITYIIMMVEVALLSREPGTRDSMDLILFSTWGDTMQSRAYVIENVIMFIPYGVLLPRVFPAVRKFHWIMLMSFSASLLIEVTQYVTKMGYFQVDDLVMNTLGGIIGFAAVELVTRGAKKVYLSFAYIEDSK